MVVALVATIAVVAAIAGVSGSGNGGTTTLTAKQKLIRTYKANGRKLAALRAVDAAGQKVTPTCGQARPGYAKAPATPKSVAAGSAAYVPAQLSDLVADADAVVDARVVGFTVAAPPARLLGTLSGRAASNKIAVAKQARRAEILTYQVVKLVVCDPLEGGLTGEFQLYRQGSPDVSIEGDAAYNVGERYLLFLHKRPDGLYRTISPEGRYFLRADGSVMSMSHGLGAILDGLPSADVALKAVRRNLMGVSPKLAHELKHDTVPSLAEAKRAGKTAAGKQMAKEYFSNAN